MASKRLVTDAELYWCCARSLEFYEKTLACSEGRVGRGYLLGRGINEKSVARWRLGWAPDEGYRLVEHLIHQHEQDDGWFDSTERMLKCATIAGVLRENDDGSQHYAALRGRVIFPIMLAGQQPIGFIGRVINDDGSKGGKYLITRDSPISQRNKELFDWHRAAWPITQRGAAVLVDGPVDVIVCHQYGFTNTLSTNGTLLAEEQADLICECLPDGGEVLVVSSTMRMGHMLNHTCSLFSKRGVSIAYPHELDEEGPAEYLQHRGADARAEFLKPYRPLGRGFHLSKKTSPAGPVKALIV